MWARRATGVGRRRRGALHQLHLLDPVRIAGRGRVFAGRQVRGGGFAFEVRGAFRRVLQASQRLRDRRREVGLAAGPPQAEIDDDTAPLDQFLRGRDEACRAGAEAARHAQPQCDHAIGSPAGRDQQPEDAGREQAIEQQRNVVAVADQRLERPVHARVQPCHQQQQGGTEQVAAAIRHGEREAAAHRRGMIVLGVERAARRRTGFERDAFTEQAHAAHVPVAPGGHAHAVQEQRQQRRHALFDLRGAMEEHLEVVLAQAADPQRVAGEAEAERQRHCGNDGAQQQLTAPAPGRQRHRRTAGGEPQPAPERRADALGGAQDADGRAEHAERRDDSGDQCMRTRAERAARFVRHAHQQQHVGQVEAGQHEHAQRRVQDRVQFVADGLHLDELAAAGVVRGRQGRRCRRAVRERLAGGRQHRDPEHEAQQQRAEPWLLAADLGLLLVGRRSRLLQARRIAAGRCVHGEDRHRQHVRLADAGQPHWRPRFSAHGRDRAAVVEQAARLAELQQRRVVDALRAIAGEADVLPRSADGARQPVDRAREHRVGRQHQHAALGVRQLTAAVQQVAFGGDELDVRQARGDFAAEEQLVAYVGREQHDEPDAVVLERVGQLREQPVGRRGRQRRQRARQLAGRIAVGEIDVDARGAAVLVAALPAACVGGAQAGHVHRERQHQHAAPLRVLAVLRRRLLQHGRFVRRDPQARQHVPVQVLEQRLVGVDRRREVDPRLAARGARIARARRVRGRVGGLVGEHLRIAGAGRGAGHDVDLELPVRIEPTVQRRAQRRRRTGEHRPDHAQQRLVVDAARREQPLGAFVPVQRRVERDAVDATGGHFADQEQQPQLVVLAQQEHAGFGGGLDSGGGGAVLARPRQMESVDGEARGLVGA